LQLVHCTEYGEKIQSYDQTSGNNSLHWQKCIGLVSVGQGG